jgi:hypothetical protein
VVEDDELVALAALSRDIPGLEGVPSSDGMDRSYQPFMPYSSGFLKIKLLGILTMPASALTFAWSFFKNAGATVTVVISQGRALNLPEIDSPSASLS